MGETLDQTRIEVEAKRAELQRIADRLTARARRTVDLKAKFKENPALFVGLGAGAVFLLAGGPMRTARFLRRRAMRTTPEKAYDALPKPMQAWVDSLSGSLGSGAERARESLAGELLRWRQEPLDRKSRKELAKQMVEGPPGPGRTSWKAFEAAAAVLSAALAKRVVERFLSGEAGSASTSPRRNAAVGAAPVGDVSAARADAEDYSAMSARSRQGG